MNRYFQDKNVMQVEEQINGFLRKRGRSLVSVQLIPQEHFYEAFIAYRDVKQEVK